MNSLNMEQVHPGMIMMEIDRGSRGYNNVLKLWEFPNNYNGQGLEYNIDGSKHEWWHASARNSYVLNKSELPEEFIFSFYHGMSDLYTTIKNGTIDELISNSNWKDKIILKSDVDNYLELKNITLKNVNDIKNIIPLLDKSKYIPRNIGDSIIYIAGKKLHNVINGESGIAVIHYDILLNQIILYLKSNLVDETKD